MTTKQEIILGIDLGTTYSCVAYTEKDRAKIVPSEKGYANIPSVVGLTKRNEVVVGNLARDQMVVKPVDTIHEFKRLIGRKFSSLVVQELKEYATYKIVEGETGDAAVLLGNKVYSLIEISSFLLKEMKKMAEAEIGQSVHKAVITVPAYYSDNQRSAVKRSGELAGLEIIRILNEPTAAAITYGFGKQLDQRILVFDLGGGTFDVSVLQIKRNEFEVLGTGGDTFLGGLDFDFRLAEDCLTRFHIKSGIDLKTQAISLQRVLAASENVKKDLSFESFSKIHLPLIAEIEQKPVDLIANIRREQLERLTMDLVSRCLQICDQVLNDIHLKKEDLDEVLLVGGQTRMPLIQNRVEEHFKIKPRKGVHPEEAVALGAAIYANSIQSKSIELKDVLSIPIGIALPNGLFKIILDKNTRIPQSRIFRVLVPKTRPLKIDVYQGENKEAAKNEFLGTFLLPPGKDQDKARNLQVTFDLNEESLLKLNSIDVESGEISSIHMYAIL